LPWVRGGVTNGFSTGDSSWLPQPVEYAILSRDQQTSADSTLSLYKKALGLRKELLLGEGSFEWVSKDNLLTYRNKTVLVIHNFDEASKELPAGKLLICSAVLDHGKLPANASAWLMV
jgi:alpha-glucosidase